MVHALPAFAAQVPVEMALEDVRLRQIDRRIRFLTKRIDAAEVVDPEAPRKGRAATQVFFGATVRYATASGTERVVSIVGVDEVDLDDLSFGHAQVGVDLALDGAGFAARTAHEHVADTLGVVLRGAPRSLRRLVVGVGVHLQDAELLGHPRTVPQRRAQTTPPNAAPFVRVTS